MAIFFDDRTKILARIICFFLRVDYILIVLFDQFLIKITTNI